MDKKQNPVVEVSSLSISYGKNRVFEDVSFSIEKEGIFSFLGRNGVGKTTLLYALSGIIPSYISAKLSGGIRIYSSPPSKIKEKFFVFQDVEDSFISNTVYEEISTYGEEGMNALKIVGLESKIDEDIFSLSYGEKHRLALAVALAGKPRLLFFDESFSSLDFYSLKRILPILRKVSQNTLIFFSTHSTQLAYELSDEVFIIDNAKIIKGKNNLSNAEKFGLRPLCRKRLYL